MTRGKGFPRVRPSGGKGISLMRSTFFSMLERIPPREWHDLGIAWFAISLAFTVVFFRNGTAAEFLLAFGISSAVMGVFLVFGVSSLTVGLGFILHELAHKFTALSYGYWAEFRKDNLMLLVAVAMAALAGIVFAAPGATVINSYSLSREQNGRISASGPAMNLLLAIPFVILAVFGGSPLRLIGVMGWQVNAMLASFNMLPVGPLDGKKILAWSPGIFGLLIGTAFVLLYLSFNPSVISGFL